MFKNIITAIILVFTMLASNVAFSGAGHSHAAPPTNEQIINKAFQDMALIVDKSELVEGQALDKSWKDVTNKKIHQKSFRHYIVAFTHAKERKTLYILLNTRGTYLGANFNGKFENL